MTTPPLPPGLVRPALADVEPYEPGRPIGAVRLETGLQEVIKLASNEGPFPPLPDALAAIAAVAPNQRLYPDPGAWALRDALFEHTKVPVEAIQPGNGVDSLIKLLCLTLLDPGDNLVMGWPSFPSWRQGALIMGAEPVLVPLTAQGAYDLDGLLAAIGPRTKMVVVVSPNNPTGGAVSADDLAAFLDRVPGHVLPVLDEAYFEYLGGDGHDGAREFLSGRQMVVTRTFSKIYGLAGLRIGYMFASPELITAVGRVRNVFDVNNVAKAAATASLGHGSGPIHDRAAATVRERTRVAARLAELGVPPLPSDGNFVFMDLGDPARAVGAFEALLERGIIIRPTRAFGAPTGIRVTIGTPVENDRFLDEFARVVSALPPAPGR